MAAAIKYRLEAYDDKIENLYRIDILQEGYTGAILLKSVGAGHIQLIKKEGVIQYTSLTFSMQSDSNFEYLEFFQYNTLKHPVKFYKNDVQIGSYLIVPESYSENYINPPYDVTITATDGLGLLANYTFSNDGIQTYLDAVVHCLDNLELDLPYSIAIDLFEENQVSTAAMLAQTYFDGTVFNGETCAYVLEQLLPFGVTLTQHDNKWLIRRPFEDIEKTHLEYSSAGVYTGTSSGETVQTLGIYGEGTVHPRGSAPLLSLEHAWREVEVTERRGLKESIIDNYTFSNYSVPGTYPAVSAVFDNWTTPITGIVCYGIYNSINYMGLLYKDTSDPANYTSDDYTCNIIKPTLAYNNGQLLYVSFDYFARVYDYWEVETSEIDGCYVAIKCGTKYASSDGTWADTETLIELTSVSLTHYPGIPNIKKFELQLGSVEAGDLEVRIYKPLKTTNNTIIFLVGNVVVTFKDGDEEDFYPAAVENTLGIREESSHAVESITITPFDLPDTSNIKYIYDNIKYYKSGASYIQTLSWSNNSQTATDYLNVLQAQLINYYGDPKQVLSGTRWRGANLHLNSVVKHALNYNRVFVAQYGTWYPLENEYNITWREKWLDFPYMDNSVAYFDRRVGDQLIDRLNGYRATIDDTGVTFPEITGSDIFDKTNTTYWGATIPNTAGDDRKWLFAELDWEFMVDYAEDAAHAALFLKDFGTDVRSTLPILVIPGRTEAQQEEITDYLETYFFHVDESGNIVIDDDNAYLVGGTI